MKDRISDSAIKQLFTEGRSFHSWKDIEVSDDLLEELYEIFKWGPTSMNSSPLRVLFIKSKAQKELLYPSLLGSNIAQVKSAPVTAIIAFDENFHEELPNLFPAYDAKPIFEADASLKVNTAFRNSSLQGAYLLIAARALGLDVCPLSGFNNKLVDDTFFQGTSWKSNFLCNLGYGIESELYPRGPRLSFEAVSKII